VLKASLLVANQNCPVSKLLTVGVKLSLAASVMCLAFGDCKDGDRQPAGVPPLHGFGRQPPRERPVRTNAAISFGDGRKPSRLASPTMSMMQGVIPDFVLFQQRELEVPPFLKQRL
jgi:hypothetical protein